MASDIFAKYSFPLKYGAVVWQMNDFIILVIIEVHTYQKKERKRKEGVDFRDKMFFRYVKIYSKSISEDFFPLMNYFPSCRDINDHN